MGQEKAEAVLSHLLAKGYERIDPPVLAVADTLFSLYGEEMWERAFFLEEGDAIWALRPDFTVSAAIEHLRAHPDAEQTKPGRFVYAGSVFRRHLGNDRDADPRRAAEQYQVGVEVFDEPSGPAEDAALFAECAETVQLAGGGGSSVIIGDLNIIFSLLNALDLPTTWRKRLSRHFWRPEKFMSLLARFSGDEQTPESRRRISFLKAIGHVSPEDAAMAVEEIIALSDTPQIGVRKAADIAERFLSQAADARRHPLPGEVAASVQKLLGVSDHPRAALESLQSIVREGGLDIDDALSNFASRLDALEAHGVALDRLVFDAGFGRNLEYYDGFIFELRRDDGTKHAGGGRYDSLFAALLNDEPRRARSRTGVSRTGVGFVLHPDRIAAGDLK